MSYIKSYLLGVIVVLFFINFSCALDLPKIKRIVKLRSGRHGLTRILIQCTVTGNPRPVLHWTFKGKRVIADSHYKLESENRVLTVVDVTKNDTGKYRCYAQNKYGMNFGEIDIKILGVGQFHAPYTIDDLPLVKNVTIGQPLELTCPPHTDKYGQNYRWAIPPLDFLNPGSPNERAFLSNHHGALYFSYITAADVKEINSRGGVSCILNVDYSNLEPSVKITLRGDGKASDAKQKPKMTVFMKNNTLAIEGDTIKILCGATGRPHPQLKWYKDGKLISKADERSSTISNIMFEGKGLVLNIYSIKKENAGLYKCVANNSEGSVSKEATFNVNSKVKFTKELQEENDIPVKQPVTLECAVTAKPKAKFVWYHNNTIISTNARRTVKEGKMHIPETDFKDSGMYLCSAENEINTVVSPAYVKILGPRRLTSIGDVVCAIVQKACEFSFPTGGVVSTEVCLEGAGKFEAACTADNLVDIWDPPAFLAVEAACTGGSVLLLVACKSIDPTKAFTAFSCMAKLSCPTKQQSTARPTIPPVPPRTTTEEPSTCSYIDSLLSTEQKEYIKKVRKHYKPSFISKSISFRRFEGSKRVKRAVADTVKVLFIAFEGVGSHTARAMDQDPSTDKGLHDFADATSFEDIYQRVKGTNFKNDHGLPSKEPDMADIVFLSESPIAGNPLNAFPNKLYGKYDLDVSHENTIEKVAVGVKVQNEDLNVPERAAKRLKLALDDHKTQYMSLYKINDNWGTARALTLSGISGSCKVQKILIGRKDVTCVIGLHLDSAYSNKYQGRSTTQAAQQDLKYHAKYEIENILWHLQGGSAAIGDVKGCSNFILIGDFNLNVETGKVDNQVNQRRYTDYDSPFKTLKCQGIGVRASSGRALKSYMGAVACVPLAKTITQFNLWYGNKFYQKGGASSTKWFWTDHNPVYIEFKAT